MTLSISTEQGVRPYRLLDDFRVAYLTWGHSQDVRPVDSKISPEDLLWEEAFAATQPDKLQQMAEKIWASVDNGEAIPLEDFLGLNEE